KPGHADGHRRRHPDQYRCLGDEGAADAVSTATAAADVLEATRDIGNHVAAEPSDRVDDVDDVTRTHLRPRADVRETAQHVEFAPCTDDRRIDIAHAVFDGLDGAAQVGLDGQAETLRDRWDDVVGVDEYRPLAMPGQRGRETDGELGGAGAGRAADH